MSGANRDNIDCIVEVRIKEAWIEEDTPLMQKLCVRRTRDTGAETFGCFRITDNICASDFIGLTIDQACRKFNSIVYHNAEVGALNGGRYEID